MQSWFRLMAILMVLAVRPDARADVQAAYDQAVTLTKESYHWDHVVSGTPTVGPPPRQPLTEQPSDLTTIVFNAGQSDIYQTRNIQGVMVDCVLVATFAQYSALWQSAQPGMDLKLNDPNAGYAIFPWVTVGSDLKNYLNTNYTVSAADLDMRIAQSLGLAPSTATQNRGLAFFWVPVVHIERPAYSADVSQQIDYANLPTNADGTYIVTTPDAGGPDFVFQDYSFGYHDGTGSFGTFVEYNQALTQAPWTAMGYTYNWNYLMDGLDGRTLDPDRVDSYLGVSEFVVSAGSWVDFDRFVGNGDLFGYVVPEPGTFLLLIAGGWAVAIRRVRRLS